MPQLRSPIDALRYALASRQQAQETGRSIGAPIGAGISRGLGMAEDRRRDAAAEKYRDAQMAQRQEEFEEEKRQFGEREGRLAAGESNEQAYRDKMLQYREEELYGGRAEDPAAVAKRQGDVAALRADPTVRSMGAGALGLTAEPEPAGFTPTLKNVADAERGERQSNADAIGMARLRLGAMREGRAASEGAARGARATWQMAAKRLKERIDDFDQTDVAWVRKNRNLLKKNPELIDKAGTDNPDGADNRGMMTPDDIRELLGMIDEAEDAYAAAKSGTSVLAPSPSDEEEVGAALDEEDDLHDSIFEGD